MACIGTGITYQWQKDGVNISKATNSSLSISESGNYTVKTFQNNCLATSLPFNITNNAGTILTNPVASKYLLLSGRTQPIQALPNDSKKYDFQWFKDALAINNSNQATININQGGKYFVRAITGKCAFTSGIVEFISVSSSRTMTFEADEKTEEAESLILFPNPTNDLLKIQYFSKENNLSEPTIEIINSLGMSILSEKLEKDSETIFMKTIDVKSMPVGVYFVRIMDGERILVKKFLRGQ